MFSVPGLNSLIVNLSLTQRIIGTCSCFSGKYSGTLYHEIKKKNQKRESLLSSSSVDDKYNVKFY